MINEIACRVCGLNQGEPPWGEGGVCPTYDICNCCGTEFGYGDCSLKAIQASRERWLLNGAYWKSPKGKPPNWSLEEQLNQIPSQYK